MSRSSLSMSMALIGNQSTVILPDCYERTSLPHWIRAPCSLPASDVATASTTRAPSLLTETAAASSVPAVGELQPQEESNCLLSQSGKDGIGHQLEGKLSCMAMASFLGMEYVHKPFFTMQHVGNPGKMAAFFRRVFWIWDSIPKHQGTHARTAHKSSVGGALQGERLAEAG